MNRLRIVLARSLFVSVFISSFALTLRAQTPVTCASPVASQPEPTEYFVSFAKSGQHLARVSVRMREGSGTRLLNMPVWNALYQVRNFAANIENVGAQDASGAAAKIFQAGTSEWQITAPPGCAVVSYDIHLDSPGPFGSAVNQEHAFVNWAMVLMYSPALRSLPMSIRLLDVPATWKMRDLHVLGAAGAGEVEQKVGLAAGYDELADSPVELGTFQQSEFRRDGATYHVVVHGDSADYDMAQIDEVLSKVTHAAVDWMQDRPYQQYTFLYHFSKGPAGGGMEHAYGTAIDMPAERLRSNLIPLASVSAHEFFHLWNVKRIRPQSLEPIDYQHEMDTRALWFSEGVTSTVGDMLLARTGLIDEKQYLRRVSVGNNRTAGPSRSSVAIGGGIEPRCVVRGHRLLSFAGAQYQLLQQRRDSRHSSGPESSSADQWRKIAARCLPVDEPALCEATTVFRRFRRR